jgi:hypothetical protein
MTILLLALAACSIGGPGVSANDTAAARATLTRLETEARALAKTEGCSAADQCRMAPVGDRPCGGPRTYIAYCAATTDSVALFRKLDEVKAAEQHLNQLTGAASTCEFRMPPVPSLSGGRCGP